MTRIHVVDDDPDMASMLRSALARRGYEVTTSLSAEDTLERIAGSPVDVVVTDLRMRGIDGIQLCERLLATYPELPVVVMTAFGSMDAAIAAMRAGASDFLAKPFKPAALATIVDRVVEQRRLVEEVSRLRDGPDAAASATESFDEIVGESPPIRALCDVLARVARSTANVLITGETGTGKELAARALHDRGPRAAGPFVTLNCAAVPETLLEDELFGHARGAYTGAEGAREGLFLRANGGTMFLDEIGDMPLLLQAKLLRVLQERTFRPVGSDREQTVDARVVSATHQDLEDLVKAGTFREDLYYRLNVVNISLPPLRDRGRDVLLLARHFLRLHSSAAGHPVHGLSEAAARRLLAYPWPGNVRELSNVIERAIALIDHDTLMVEDLPAHLRGDTSNARAIRTEAEAEAGDEDPGEPGDVEDLVSIQELERRHILRVLAAVGGNKARAARILGLDRKTLYRRLNAYESDESRESPGETP